MTTEAQINANRSNAQKSTGPRTAEGKAKVAQNAVRHGLRAQGVVSQGEDPGEFALFREEMLAELAPAGTMESLLAERIVGLSWRLLRAERLQTAAVGTLAEEKKKWVWSEEDKQYVILQATKPGRIIPGSEAEALAADQKLVKDFAEGGILDRLLVYEGRIEHHLYRTMAQLEKRQRLGREGGVSSSPCGVSGESGRTWNPAGAERSDGNSGLSVPADVTPPAGTSTNVPEAEGQSCGTKPIHVALAVETPHPATVPSFKESDLRPEAQGLARQTKPISAVPRGTGSLPVSEDHGQDAYATEPPASVTPGRAEVQGQTRQTKPICTAPCDTGIPSAPLSGQALPVSEDHGQDAHATEPLGGVTPGGVEVQGQTRQTKPICVGMNDRPVGYRPIFRRRG